MPFRDVAGVPTHRNFVKPISYTVVWSIIAVLCPLAAWGQSYPTRVEIAALPPGIIQSRLESVTPKVADRRSKLETLFREAGCDGESLSEQALLHRKDPNIVCVLPGRAKTTIVVGGHYDVAGKSTGAVDDWSGAVLLPSLYQGLKTKTRRHTFVFIAFAAEEDGLVGSSDYVKQLSEEERKSIGAMINLECLGVSPPKVWASRANKDLLKLYVRAVAVLGIKPEASNLDQLGDDDSYPFLKARIPVLTIHSITRETLPILHSPSDRLDVIRPDDYFSAYRLAATFLTALDEAPE